ncbi:MAG: sigma-54 dependent transcriptional regulator [Methylotetracoccus sp.]
MSDAVVLIIDDEPDIRELIAITLRRMDVHVKTAANVAEAKAVLQHHALHLVLTDMRLPDGDGLDLVDYIQEHYPKLPVAVITAHGNMDAAIRALKNGAFDFVPKPIDLEGLRRLVDAGLRLGLLGDQIDRRSRDTLIGESPAIREIRSKIVKLARSQAPIFISGESGTGKDLVARLIHSKSARADKPFVVVNCGAIPSELMESEFFGHRKGSFTGAIADKQGLFKAADGGTLFLDEVADLPLSLQVKLLRAIQEKSFRPVGDSAEIRVDVRILSASHKNLPELVRDGAFRQDLFYRINVIELNVPPLRARSEDIPLLAERILARLGRMTGVEPVRLSDDAMARLSRYRFPGNVRELENVLERAVALCEGAEIQAEDMLLSDDAGIAAYAMREAVEANPDPGVPLDRYMEDMERRVILEALEQTRWNRTAAARQLGLTFRSLRYRLKRLGLE